MSKVKIDYLVAKQMAGWQPKAYLSTVAIAYYQEAQFANQRLFPVCPVQLPSGFYYEFSKADLARDNVHRKPDYGTVAPTVLGQSEHAYSCHVDQIIIGLDKIITLAYQRAQGGFDPQRARARSITEMIANHQEIEFAKTFFKTGVWGNEWTGAASADTANKKFKKFDNSDVDPVVFFDERITEIRRIGRRRPNKLALGMETFNALKNNPFILERIKYSGTTQNPAVVNENVLAQIFGVEQVIVLDATHNAAPHGAEDMQYVCDSKGALLLYAPDTPQLDAPSAGYCFTWLLPGGNYIAIDTFEKNDGSHTDFMEGLIAYDMRKTSDALAVYLGSCCG